MFPHPFDGRGKFVSNWVNSEFWADLGREASIRLPTTGRKPTQGPAGALCGQRDQEAETRFSVTSAKVARARRLPLRPAPIVPLR
jgi:hypothetical protein